MKFRKATKKIAAVAASAVLVSSSVAAAGNFPSMFEKDGKFAGQVVIGSNAAASDNTAAEALIADLKDMYSGDQVRITYRSSTTGGDVVNAVKQNEALNYGEKLGDVTEQTGFDDGDSSLLGDVRFSNGISDEDYEQTLTLKGGTFNYALKDNVDGVTEIADGIYYADGDVFAEYKVDFKTAIDLSVPSTQSDLDNDMVGKEMTLMGNTFTITSISRDSTDTKDLKKLELLGGANKVSLGEGESTSVTIDGKNYDVSVQSVGSSEVLVTVNGETKTIDKFDTEKLAGITIGVTDLIASSRDSVKGYSELVLGGQKVTLEDGNKLVKVNDNDIDDVYPGYEVYSDFSDGNSGMDTITLTYKVKDDTLLRAGDKLDDTLFNAFSVVFDGTNNPDYTEVKLTVDDDDVKIEGTTEKGEPLTLRLHSNSNTDSNPEVWIRGDQDGDRIFTQSSTSTNIPMGVGGITAATEFTLTLLDGNTVIVDGKTFEDDSSSGGVSPGNIAYDGTAADLVVKMNANGIKANNNGGTVTVANPSSEVSGTAVTGATASTTFIAFDLTNNDIKGSGFLLTKDSEEQYLYELTSVDTTDVNHYVDLDEWLRGDNEKDVKRTEWGSKLGMTLNNDLYSANYTGLQLTELGDVLAFNNNVLLNVANAEDDNNDGTIDSTLVIGLDKDDVSADDTIEESDSVKFGFSWDTTDTEFNIVGLEYYKNVETSPGQMTTGDISSLSANGAFVNNGEADVSDANSDVQEFVTKYGIKVRYDNDQKRSATVMVPSEQVRANVNLVFGETSSTMSKVVSADEVEAVKKSLEDDGYTIVSTESMSSDVEFSVEAPILDSEVTEVKDLIVVGGPAVNSVARELLGIETYTVDQAGVQPGEGKAKIFEEENSVLIYGYSAEDTRAIVDRVIDGSANFE